MSDKSLFAARFLRLLTSPSPTLCMMFTFIILLHSSSLAMLIKISTLLHIWGSSVHWFKLQNLHKKQVSDKLGYSGGEFCPLPSPHLPPHAKPPLLLIHLSYTPSPDPSSILHLEQSKSIIPVLCWPCCLSLTHLKAFNWLFLGWLRLSHHSLSLTPTIFIRFQLWRHLLWQQFLFQPQVFL